MGTIRGRKVFTQPILAKRATMSTGNGMKMVAMTIRQAVHANGPVLCVELSRVDVDILQHVTPVEERPHIRVERQCVGLLLIEHLVPGELEVSVSQPGVHVLVERLQNAVGSPLRGGKAVEMIDIGPYAAAHCGHQFGDVGLVAGNLDHGNRSVGTLLVELLDDLGQ
jgi:hypothetical protein